MLRITRWMMENRRVVRGVSVAGALIASVVLAASGQIVFRPSPTPSDQSVWHVVFSDRVTIGFLRLASIAICLYAIASAAALIAGGRWLKGLGSSGLQMDDAQASDEVVEEYKTRARRAEQARDEAVELARAVMRWLNQM